MITGAESRALYQETKVFNCDETGLFLSHAKQNLGREGRHS